MPEDQAPTGVRRGEAFGPGYRLRVRATGAHLDANGHVNNVVYLQWMQDAAVAHARAAGAMAAAADLGATWVARSHHVEYLAPATAGDDLLLLTWVSEIQQVRSRRRYRVLRPADGREIARGETLWVFVDRASGRPLRIPDSVASCFTPLPTEQEPQLLANALGRHRG